MFRFTPSLEASAAYFRPTSRSVSVRPVFLQRYGSVIRAETLQYGIGHSIGKCLGKVRISQQLGKQSM